MKTIIGLGGPAGSGKDSLSAALTERGCVEFYSGGHLRKRAAEEAFVPAEPTREAFVPFWQAVADKEGRDWLAQAALEQHEKTGKTVVFNGTRIPEDADYIELNNGVNLFLPGSAEDLYKRIMARHREDDGIIKDFGSYKKFHAAEMDGTNEIAIGDIASRSEHFILPLQFISDEQDRTLAYGHLADYVLNLIAH